MDKEFPDLNPLPKEEAKNWAERAKQTLLAATLQ
jgi:hypothetical protein